MPFSVVTKRENKKKIPGFQCKFVVSKLFYKGTYLFAPKTLQGLANCEVKMKPIGTLEQVFNSATNSRCRHGWYSHCTVSHHNYKTGDTCLFLQLIHQQNSH